MRKAILYKTDGTVTEVTPANGRDFQYKELKQLLGDVTLQFVPLPSGKTMICDDNGKLDGREENVTATEIWKKEYPIKDYPHNNDELIVGDVIICDDGMVR